jgi:hypothetical protein
MTRVEAAEWIRAAGYALGKPIHAGVLAEKIANPDRVGWVDGMRDYMRCQRRPRATRQLALFARLVAREVV